MLQVNGIEPLPGSAFPRLSTVLMDSVGVTALPMCCSGQFQDTEELKA